jgi:hypothetical protein
MCKEVIIWKRDSEGNKEVSYEPQAEELGAAKALREAIEALRPYTEQPGIGNAVQALVKATGENDSESEVVKALGDVHNARVALAKSDNPDPALSERLKKAATALQHEYLWPRSPGYQNAVRDRREEESKRIAQLGGRGEM